MDSQDGRVRMREGVGISGEEGPTHVTATRKGMFPDDNTGGDRSQGETPGAGSIYAAVLNERPNISNPRNQGPERAPSRIGDASIPVATIAQRNTGKLS